MFDTPISEAGIAGTAVGLAFAGWRSVIEMQFDAFSYPALEQVIDHVAKMRERTRGRVDMPITIRIPSFGGIKGKEHHGESPETYYVHTAGLKVVVPSSPLDGYRLLRLAIADPDPVVVLEPKARYWGKEEGDLTTDGPGIGEGRVLREGDACAIVSYGSMVTRVLAAADALAAEGIAARVARPAFALAARRRPARRRGQGHRTDRGGPRGAAHARDGRRGRRPRDGARVRLPGGARRARDRLGRAVPARLARGALPADRRADHGRRPQGGGVLMAERIFAMPDLGEGLEEGEIVAWLVAAGDAVELNQPLVEVETAKATVEIPSPFAGLVVSVHGDVGQAVPVGDVLVTFDVRTGTPAGPGAIRWRSLATPAVRKLAKTLGVDLGTLAGTGPSGRVTAEDVQAAAGVSAPAASEGSGTSRWSGSRSLGGRSGSG